VARNFALKKKKNIDAKDTASQSTSTDEQAANNNDVEAKLTKMGKKKKKMEVAKILRLLREQ
jgi:hypothetical protein